MSQDDASDNALIPFPRPAALTAAKVSTDRELGFSRESVRDSARRLDGMVALFSRVLNEMEAEAREPEVQGHRIDADSVDGWARELEVIRDALLAERDGMRELGG